MNNTQKQLIWDKASDAAKERYCKFTSDDSFSEWDETWELEGMLTEMVKAYYLEDRSADEGILCGIQGFDEEDKAVDMFLEGYSKYGSWYLYKWDETTKTWLQGDTKRTGKNIEIVWSPND